MYDRRAFLSAVCVLALAIPASAAIDDRAAPAKETAAKREAWHRVLLQGKPAGYLMIAEQPLEDGGWLTRQRTRLTIRRGPTPLVIEVVEEVEEDEEGKVRGFLVEQKFSERVMTVRGRLRDGAMEITTAVEGQEPRPGRIPIDPDSIGPHRADQLAQKRLHEEGDELRVVLFVPQLQRSTELVLTLGPEETVELPGGEVEARRLQAVLEALPTAAETRWVDEDFDMVKSSVRLAGMKLVTLRSTREAVLEAEGGTPPEIYFASGIAVDRPPPRQASKVRYRLNWKGEREKAPTKLPSLPAQEVVEESGRSRIVEVRTVEPKTGGVNGGDTGELRPFLESNAYIQSDEPGIRELAEEVAGKEADSWNAARLLERWVHRNLTEKNLRTNFATAAEVLERREGDCTEHAVLLAALARARKIPARLVVGLVYHRGAFVGHMWTEVHCGIWVPLDATLGKGRVGPDRIALAVSSLSEKSIADLFLAPISSLGNLEIEVLDESGR